jgi:glucose dehydrogenase
MSREGQAFCVDLASGRVVWQKQLAELTRAPSPQWGFSGSPLVEGNTAYYNINSGGVAVDKNTGRIQWTTPVGDAGYSSPIIYTINGQKTLVLFSGWGVLGSDPTTGRSRWSYQWETSFNVNAADPIVVGTNVFISSNYEKGCALLDVSSGKAKMIYQNKNMRNHFHTCILIDGYLYGNDQGNLKCIEMKSGKQMWRTGGMGRGGIIAADKKLIVLTERGELMVVAATPSRYQEISQAKILDGECWTHPVLSNGKIYARNHEGTLVCLDVKGR